MSDFYYTVDWYVIRRHKRTGKIVNEGWQGHSGDYATLEEALEDNPPGKHRYRFIKRYYEVVHEQKAQE